MSSWRDSIASMPVADIRPTSRRARSHIRSASATPGDDHSAVGAAVAGVDDDPLAAQPRAGLAQQLLLAQQVRPAAGDLAAQLAQRAQGGGPAQAVGHEAVLALELAQRPSVCSSNTPPGRPGS